MAVPLNDIRSPRRSDDSVMELMNEVLLEHRDGCEYMALELWRYICAEDINWGLTRIQIAAVGVFRGNIYQNVNAEQITSWETATISWWVKRMEPTMN